MIALRVTLRPDGAAAGADRCVVRADGITVGRAPDCQLVLDDPQRTVSRRQAFLLPCGEREALLRCISTSVEVEVNGVPIGPEIELLVRPGDRLRIGAFELDVEADGLEAMVADRRQAPPAVVARAAEASAPAPLQAAARVAETARVPAPAAPQDRRIDRWFDLDHAADPLGVGAAAGRAAAGSARDAPAHAGLESTTPVDFDPFTPDPHGGPPAEAVNVAAYIGADAVEALRRAFLRGAGLPDSTPLSLTPASMQHLGSLLLAATEALVDEVQRRSVVQPGLRRAETAHVGEREHNPLKFAPGGAEALRLLIGGQPPIGFMPPLQALQDTRRDLQARQLAVAAGMRAVLSELLEALGPQAEAAMRGSLPGWVQALPPLRDAALWRLHCERHAELAARLDGTIESHFEREFLAAYQSLADPSSRDGAARG